MVLQVQNVQIVQASDVTFTVTSTGTNFSVNSNWNDNLVADFWDDDTVFGENNDDTSPPNRHSEQNNAIGPGQNGTTAQYINVVDNTNPANPQQLHTNLIAANEHAYFLQGPNGQTITASLIHVIDHTAPGFNATASGHPMSIITEYYVFSAPIQSGVNYTITSEDSFPNHTDATTLSYAQLTASNVVCFAGGTLIDTDRGPVPIETLRQGDKVITQARGAQPLRWIYARRLNAADLRANPKLSPVRISAGACGQGLPHRDLLVSRQHRMLVRSKVAKRMFDCPDVLIPAIKLTALPGIYVDESLSQVTYFHLAFEQHEVVFAEGAPSESFFPGPEALKTLDADAQEEFLTLFQDVLDQKDYSDPACPIPPGHLQKKLVERHRKNNKQLLEI